MNAPLVSRGGPSGNRSGSRCHQIHNPCLLVDIADHKEPVRIIMNSTREQQQLLLEFYSLYHTCYMEGRAADSGPGSELPTAISALLVH